jgi:predicted ATPase/DNA-binding SARP family transcriptional activator
MPTLQLQLRGGLRVTYDDAPLEGLNSARIQSLLAYLLLHRQAPQNRQHLAFQFWPDSIEAKARANLRFFLHRLRRALPEADRFLQIDESSVMWRADAPFTLDVAGFEDALADAEQKTGEAATRALERAVLLYHGELLPGYYDDWILPERERLQQLCLSALGRLMQVLENQGEYRAAVSHAQRLLRYDPLHEATYRHLMRLHALNGDRVGALRVYHACVAVLERELSVEPNPATRAQYDQLLSQAAPATPAAPGTQARASPEYAALHVPQAPPNNLRLALSSFIGREREIGEIARRLASTRLLTLTGMGGSGKTRLALEIATQQLVAPSAPPAPARYEDGIWWIELVALDDPGLVTQAVAAALGVREQRLKSLSDTLIEALRAKQLLLVLDNCEHVIAACAQLAQALLRGCPGVSILATSREPLKIAGETVWPVPPLSLPDQEPRSGWEALLAVGQSEAVRLFTERAALAFPAFELTANNALAVAEMCRQLDGLPLAIELAAARVKVLTVQQIRARLDDCFNLLRAGQRQGDARHQSLRAVMDWSYELLAPSERLLFQRLSVFAGSFTLEAVEAVCAGDGIEPGQLLELVSLLLDKSLVQVEQDADEARFDLLETIRQYARDKLLETNPAEAWQRRHADFYLALAERANAELRGPQQALWLARLEREHDNLRAALAWSQTPAGHAELGLRLAGSLWRFWDMRGYLGEGRRALENGLARVAARTAVRASALDGAGWLAYSQGDHLAARALHEESLQIWREVGDPWGMALALNNLGNVAWKQADYPTARQFHEESLKIRRELGDPMGIAASLHNLGMVAWNQGDYLGARALYEESLALKRPLGDKWGMATSANALGAIALELGELDVAQARYAESLALAQELGDKVGIAMVLTNMGEAAQRQADYPAARGYLEQSLVLKRELGNRWGMANSLNLLGLVFLGQGDPGAAGKVFAESLALRREVDDQRGIAHGLAGLAGVAWLQRQPERAARLLGASEAMLEAFGSGLDVPDQALYDRTVAALRAQLSEEHFAAAWATGRALPLKAAIAEAMRMAELAHPLAQGAN